MSTREGAWQSKNDHNFILRSLRNGRRIDGRRPGDMRLLRMVFARAEGQASCEVQLGRTRVLAVVKGEVVPPFPDRPTEGFLHFNVELGAMAAASVGERNSPLSVEIARVIEIGVRDSQALDTEALCILGGEKVWQLRCDVHILDHGGNLIDASTIATMAALRHFRRPEVSIDGNKVVVHHTDDKEPQPLALHHVPICVTFAIFEDNGESAQGHRPGAGGGTTSQNRGTSGRKPGGGGKGGLAPGFRTTQHTAVDPSEAEEDVMKGRITFALTAHKELCALHKNGGVAVTSETILKCARLAAVKVEEIHGVLDEALTKADVKAGVDRQRRLRGTAPSTAGSGSVPPAMVVPVPGTRSTPFVVGQPPMPVAAESLEVKHLEYDDLHVTQSIREEGLRGGGNRGGRGLDIADARNTDLFAKMAKAASMTQASMDDGNQTPRNSHGSIAAGRAGGGGGGLGGGKTELHNRNDPPSSKSAPSFASPSGVFGRKGGNDNTMEEGQGEAGVEFERLAQSLKESAAVVAGGVVNLDGAKGRSSDVAVGAGGTEKGGRTLKGQRPSPPTTMDVDSDEEEETVTLRGEFQSASASAAAGGSRNVGVGGGEATASTAHIEAAVLPVKGECGVVANDDEEDLVSAVKKGKGRKGKGSEKGRKLGKRKT